MERRIPLPKDFLIDDCFQIDSQIAANGCSYTYLATDLETQLKVCIQEFFPVGCRREEDGGVSRGDWERSDWRGARSAFFENAQRLSGLRHPGLLRPFQVLACNRSVYLVTECLVAPSLEEWILARGPLAENGARRLIQQGLSALEVLHQNQLIHGGIQPRNLMLSQRGLVLTNLELLPQSSGWPAIWHTPGYTDPEFSKTGALTRRSDIYSLGATLYHCLAGQPPSGRERPQGQVTDLRDFRPDLDLNLELTVSRALEFESTHRPSSLSRFWHSRMAEAEESVALTRPQLDCLLLGLLVESWAQIALIPVLILSPVLLVYLPAYTLGRILLVGSAPTLKGRLLGGLPSLLGCLAIPAFLVNFAIGVSLWIAGNLAVLAHFAMLISRLGQEALFRRILGIAVLQLVALVLLAVLPTLSSVSVEWTMAYTLTILALWTAAWVFYCKLIYLLRQGVRACRTSGRRLQGT